MERHEHLPGRHAVGNPAGDEECVAPGRHARQIPVLQAERRGVGRVDLHDGGRLALVEPRRATGHGTGVPVVQLAARVHHERVRGIRELDGRSVLDGHEARFAVRRGKPLVEQESRARMVGGRHGILQARALQTLVGHARPARGYAHDLAHHILRRRMGRLEAQPVRQLDQDLQVVARVARRARRLPGELDAPLGVHEGAGLLGEARAW